VIALQSLSPLHLFLPRTSVQNFETIILFSIVKRSNNYVFGDDNHTRALKARVVIYKIRSLLTCSIRYREMLDLVCKKKATVMQVKLSQNVDGSVDLNQNTLCALGLSKGRISRVT